MTRFAMPFTPRAEDIDANGHVNNAVWVRWIQEIAIAHWQAVAPPDHQAAYSWVVTRHIVDYRGNIAPGQTAIGETWVDTPPTGARFDRNVRFLAQDGRVVVEAVTTWALLDRASGRLLRVRPDIAAPFYRDG